MTGGSLTVLLLLGAAAVVVRADLKHDFNHIEDRLDEVTYRLVSLQHKVEGRVDNVRIGRARNVRTILESLVGTGCGRMEYQCGGEDPQCVSVLMVCDGRADCRNGNDEKYCVLPLKAGDFFEGHMIFDSCTKRQPDKMTMRVTGITEASDFKSYVRVNTDIGIDVTRNNIHVHVELPTFGWYSHGLRRLVLMPPEKDGLGLVCTFGAGSTERCVVDIKHEGSATTCAKLVFVRKH